MRATRSTKYVYEPRIAKEQTQQRLPRHLLQRAFDGSAKNLVLGALSSQKVQRRNWQRYARRSMNSTRGRNDYADGVLARAVAARDRPCVGLDAAAFLLAVSAVVLVNLTVDEKWNPAERACAARRGNGAASECSRCGEEIPVQAGNEGRSAGERVSEYRGEFPSL